MSGDGSARSVDVVVRAVAGTNAKLRVLLVADADVAGLPVTQPVRDALETLGAVETWSPPRGEPALASANELAQVARAFRADVVVGLGGGSALDLAKIGGAAVTNAGSVESFLGADNVSSDPVPLVLLPTTAGTGSEVTGVCTLSAGGRKAVVSSARLIPAAAILDPLLTVSLPSAQTAATGLDALSHALESLLSTKATAFTASAASGATDLIARNLEIGCEDGENLTARRALLYGAHLAGLALNASVVVGHSIAYTIANRTGLPHGVTCALALPFCLRYNADQGARLAPAVDALTASSRGGGAPPNVGELAGHVRALATRVGIPASLAAVGIERSAIPQMVDECIGSYARPNNPVPIERRDLTALYEHLYDGDIEGYRGPSHGDRV